MESIDLKVFFNKLLKNWLIIVLCCVIGASSAFIYSEYFATPMYMSKIKMSVKSSDWESGVSISGIETTLKLVENCLVVLEDDITAELVVDVLEQETGEKYSTGFVKGAVSYSQIGESNFIQVTAKTADPELSALICNAVAAKAPQVIVDSVANIQIDTLDNAKVVYSPYSPNTSKNIAIGGILGVVLVCVVLFLIVLFDNTVSDEAKIRERYDISVLGVIPNNEGGVKKKKAYK